MDIQLNFINQSNDANNSQVVIFQKNAAADSDELAVAWKVIQNCGRGSSHPFSYPLATQVSMSDSYGNFSPRLEASEGQQFAAARNASGDILQPIGASVYPHEIELVKNLPQGAVNACIYKAGKLLALKNSVAPQQKAVFQFTPTIWIGVAAQVTEGELMNSAILSNINTEISLLGIASADIMMAGGGPGPQSKPFQFHLVNVVMA